MIRRKLTRLEVTLDDTKELDDLFSKPVQASLTATASATAATSLNNSNNLSKISNSFHQKQLLFIGKDYESAADRSASKINSSNAEAEEQNSASNIQPTSTASETNEASSTDPAQIGYNPQPYNPTNRFQFNQESQQLR